MKPEKLVEELKREAQDKLKAVVLYGSAAAGDYVGKKSDYNILVVATDLSQSTLKSFSEPAKSWQKAGNPSPLLFTEERLKQATDVFPIELHDIVDSHKILYGEDVIADIELDTANLRLELEHELRGKLIQLRQRYLSVAGKRKQVVDLMIQSIGTFLVLFRAALRLFENEVPAKKIDALKQLTAHIDFDPDVFIAIQSLKSGEKNAKDIDAEDIFGRYILAVEKIVDEVDSYIKAGGSQ